VCNPRFPDPHDGIRKLIDDHIPYRNLQEAKLPVHMSHRFISGDRFVLSEGSTARRSSPRPDSRAFTPIHYRTIILPMARSPAHADPRRGQKGAKRLIILPTGTPARRRRRGRRGR